MNQIDKPIVLKIDDFRKELISMINNSNIPIFIMEYIMKEVYQEIKETNDQYLQMEQQRYQTELAKNKEIISNDNDKEKN